jgi:hypothetical protein
MVVFRWLSALSLCLLAVGCSSKDGPTGTSTTDSAGIPIAVQPDGGEWKSFRNPEGKYVVMLPGEAIEIPVDDKTVVNHGVELENGGGYTVMYATVDEVPAADIEQRLALIQADVVGKRKLLYEDKPKVAGHPARDFAFVDDDGDAQYYRLLIVGNRLYQVMTVIDEKKFAEAKVDRQRFLDSFELIE